MLKFLLKDHKTDAIQIETRLIPHPMYDIGMKVIWEDEKEKSYDGIITGITIHSSLTKKQDACIYQVIYTIDDGANEIFEEEIMKYYPDKVIVVA